MPRAVRGAARSAARRARDVPLDAGAGARVPGARGAAAAGEPTAFGGTVLKSDGSIARGWVVVEGGRIVSVRSHQAARCRARDQHRRCDPARAHRPARPSGVQRVRCVGAAQGLHQPRPVAGQRRVRPAHQEALEHADLRREVGVGEDRDDPVRRGAGRGGGCDGDPGRIPGLPEEGRGAGPQRRPARLRQPGRPQHGRLRPPRSPTTSRASARASSTPGRSRPTTCTSRRGRRPTRRR